MAQTKEYVKVFQCTASELDDIARSNQYWREHAIISPDISKFSTLLGYVGSAISYIKIVPPYRTVVAVLTTLATTIIGIMDDLTTTEREGVKSLIVTGTNGLDALRRSFPAGATKVEFEVGCLEFTNTGARGIAGSSGPGTVRNGSSGAVSIGLKTAHSIASSRPR